jgi:hypothetical protein
VIKINLRGHSQPDFKGKKRRHTLNGKEISERRMKGISKKGNSRAKRALPWEIDGRIQPGHSPSQQDSKEKKQRQHTLSLAAGRSCMRERYPEEGKPENWS